MSISVEPSVNGSGSAVTVTDGKADPELAAIQRLVESSNNYHATRFERSVFNRITNVGTTPTLLQIQRCNQCTTDTARQIYSTSYGAYQIMGFNLYDPAIGWAGTIQNYLNDSVAQDSTYFYFLRANHIAYTWRTLKANPTIMTEFAIHYNGSDAYVLALKKAAASLGL
jgi:hypothetical protein